MRPLAAVDPRLRGLERDYAALPSLPLLVRAWLGTPYVAAEPPDGLHLDGLLSWAVLSSRPYPLPQHAVATVVPLPVQCLWTSAAGLPLWATTLLRPTAGRSVHGVEYWHKRYPSDRADWDRRGRAVTSRGRWKEYRMPLNVVRCESLEALVLGHAGRLEQLLAHVTHVGKKGSMGYGRVLRWEVVPLPIAKDETVELIQQRRPMPIEALLDSSRLLEAGMPDGGYVRSWTPPHWYAPWHLPCLEASR